MQFEASRVEKAEIANLREQYCREMNAQIVRYSWLDRGFADPFALWIDGEVVGHAIMGGSGMDPRDTITEFFVVASRRGYAAPLFRRLLDVTGAQAVHAQTNDSTLMLMLFDFAHDIEPGAVLFHDGWTTCMDAPGPNAYFRKLTALERERVFVHEVEPIGDWAVEMNGQVVATGGALLHYNHPYADLHMEVAPAFRRHGVGSYLLQELKRTCRELGRIPAARCDANNLASRACLVRAGLWPCARMLIGRIAQSGARQSQSGSAPRTPRP